MVPDFFYFFSDFFLFLSGLLQFRETGQQLEQEVEGKSLGTGKEPQRYVKDTSEHDQCILANTKF